MRVAPTVTSSGWAGGTTPTANGINTTGVQWYSPSGAFYADVTPTILQYNAEL